MDTTLPFPREALAGLCRRWRILELSVFGSVARGSSRADKSILYAA
jgi:predicted nucleotidyltransferase